ncbi:MAG: Omp28 family outer membrane lipoprotein [Bacteroidota bacterium]
MKRLFTFAVFWGFSVLIFLGSCDKIDPPYKEAEAQDGDTLVKRNFLLEEFTGHLCPNCPQGAIVAQQLKDVYGERLIIVSIHASDEFAAPGSGEFNYDFRSQTGNDIFGFFPPFGFPSGLVSRTGWPLPENTLLNKDSWGSRIESLKDFAPVMSIELSMVYDTVTRKVDATIECNVLTDFSGTYKIAAYITEDSIVHAQMTENDPEHTDNIIHDYVHRHVLRGSMNGTWGDTLVSGNITTNQEFVKNSSATLNAEWNEKQCYVVVFVYDAENYEIMQVEEKKIK